MAVLHKYTAYKLCTHIDQGSYYLGYLLQDDGYARVNFTTYSDWPAEETLRICFQRSRVQRDSVWIVPSCSLQHSNRCPSCTTTCVTQNTNSKYLLRILFLRSHQKRIEYLKIANIFGIHISSCCGYKCSFSIMSHCTGTNYKIEVKIL